MNWLNGVLIGLAVVGFPGSVYHYMVHRPSSTEHFITEMREKRLSRKEIQQLARMHVTVLGDETALHLIKAGEISDNFARNLMLGINPISEMQRMHVALVPASALAFMGAVFGLGKRYGWSAVVFPALAASISQLFVYEKRSGKIVGDMRYSSTFRNMKFEKMYGNKKI